jgi:hypothetical protein
MASYYVTQIRVSQVGTLKIVIHASPLQAGTTQVGITHVDMPQISLFKRGAMQTGIPQVSTN